MKKDFCTLYLIRHGETEWNRNRVIMGHSDSPLTPEGVNQTEELRRELCDVKFDRVYSSDLPRAMRTAELVAEGRGLDVQKSVGLRERTFGRFEGMPVEQYLDESKETMKRLEGLSTDENWKFKVEEGVENNVEILSRFTSELQAISRENPSKTILVSTHGGCIRMLLMKLGYAPYGSLPPRSFKNSGFVTIRCDGEDVEIDSVKGATMHFENRHWG